MMVYAPKAVIVVAVPVQNETRKQEETCGRTFRRGRETRSEPGRGRETRAEPSRETLAELATCAELATHAEQRHQRSGHGARR